MVLQLFMHSLPFSQKESIRFPSVWARHVMLRALEIFSPSWKSYWELQTGNVRRMVSFPWIPAGVWVPAGLLRL